MCIQQRFSLRMDGSRWGIGGPGNPLKNHTHIGFLSNTGPDPLKNHKATKPAFNVGPSSARQRNAIRMAFRWRADDGPIVAVFGSSRPTSTKKQQHKTSKLDTLFQSFLDPRMLRIRTV